MKAHFTVDLSIAKHWEALTQRTRRANDLINKLKAHYPGRSLYLRDKERHALHDILIDMQWRGRTIAIPAYTCDSLLAAVEQSGNTARVYDVGEQLQLPEQLDLEGVDALLVSEVYGQSVKRDGISPEFKGLIIGDFAHHSSLFHSRADDYDILLYSGAYYKPIKSPGMGLGLVRNTPALADSIRMNDSLLPNLFAMLQFYLTKRVIGSGFGTFLFRRALKRPYESNTLAKDPCSAQAFTASLAYIAQQPTRLPAGNLLRSYHEEIAATEGIQVLFDHWAERSHIPVLCAPRLRESVLDQMAAQGYALGRSFDHPIHFGDRAYPVSNSIAERILLLPILENEEELREFFTALRAVIERHD